MKSVNTTTTYRIGSTSDIKSLALKITNNNKVKSVFYVSPAGYDFKDIKSLLISLSIDSGTNNEKCIKIWRAVSDYTFFEAGYRNTTLPHHPMKLLNSIGGGLCDDANTALAEVYRSAGFIARVHHITGHTVCEVFYDDKWHMFDADRKCNFKDSANNIVNVAYLEKHPEILDHTSDSILPWSIIPPERTLKKNYTSVKGKHIGIEEPENGSPYSSVCALGTGESISFLLDKKAITTNFSSPTFSSDGLYNVQGTYCYPLNVDTNSITICKSLPYGIYSISISTWNEITDGNNFQVYFSTDSIRWYFKGTLCRDKSTVTFNVNSENGKEPLVFRYYLKFKLAQPTLESASLNCAIRNYFRFNERLFINKNKSFKIVRPNTSDYLDISVAIHSKKGK